MPTFYRNGDKLDAWDLVNITTTEGDIDYIDFMQGDYVHFTVCCEDNEPYGGYVQFNRSLTIGSDDLQEYDVSLSDPRFSEFAEWAKQIIKEEQETDQ